MLGAGRGSLGGALPTRMLGADVWVPCCTCGPGRPVSVCGAGGWGGGPTLQAVFCLWRGEPASFPGRVRSRERRASPLASPPAAGRARAEDGPGEASPAASGRSRSLPSPHTAAEADLPEPWPAAAGRPPGEPRGSTVLGPVLKKLILGRQGERAPRSVSGGERRGGAARGLRPAEHGLTLSLGSRPEPFGQESDAPHVEPLVPPSLGSYLLDDRGASDLPGLICHRPA